MLTWFIFTVYFNTMITLNNKILANFEQKLLLNRQ